MDQGRGIGFDSHRGEIRLGSRTVVATAAGSSGELRLHGPDGTVLRPLTFGERNLLTRRAAESSSPDEEVATLIRDAAIVTRGLGPTGPERDLTETAVALMLAGATVEAPCFDTVTFLLGRSGGWSLADIAGAMASEVDRLALSQTPKQSPESQGDGWHRIVLVDEQHSTRGEDLNALVADLAGRLLARLDQLPIDDFELDPDDPDENIAPLPGVARTSETIGSARLTRAAEPARSAISHETATWSEKRTVHLAQHVEGYSRSEQSGRWHRPITDAMPAAEAAPALSPSQEPARAQTETRPIRSRDGTPSGEIAAFTHTADDLASRPIDIAERRVGAARQNVLARANPQIQLGPDSIGSRVVGFHPNTGNASPRGLTHSAPQLPLPDIRTADTPGSFNQIAAPISPPTQLSLATWADELALLLDEEADLRGLDK
jgi:hypothetical protein